MIGAFFTLFTVTITLAYGQKQLLTYLEYGDQIIKEYTSVKPDLETFNFTVG